MSDHKTDLNSSIWRRFGLKDESKKQAVIALIQQKGLSREDLVLLLNTIQINEHKPNLMKHKTESLRKRKIIV